MAVKCQFSDLVISH